MILNAISGISNNGSCNFFTENGNILYHTKTNITENNRVTLVYDISKCPLANIKCSYFKFKAKEFYIEEIGKSPVIVILDGKNRLVCEKFNVYLYRSCFNKRIKIYCSEKLVAKVACNTIFRQWMQGKYKIDILDDSKINIVIYMMIIAFIAISDEYICNTTKNSF